MLSPSAQDDIREFYSFYNPDKLPMVPLIIADAHKKGLCAPAIFNSLYSKYGIKRLPKRLNIVLSMKQLYPTADDEIILSVLRQLEFKNGSEDEAISMLEIRLRDIQREEVAQREKNQQLILKRHAEQQADLEKQQSELLEQQKSEELERIEQEDVSTPSTSRPSSPAPVEILSRKQTAPAPAQTPYGPQMLAPAKKSKQSAEEIMSEELREWLLGMVGDYFDFTLTAGGLLTGGHKLRTERNVCDALRDGAVLAVLQQRLKNPSISVSMIKKPRTQGFFGRENTSIFIKFAKVEYQLKDGDLCTDSDLCDAKNDKNAINFLLRVASAVYKQQKESRYIHEKAVREATARYGSAVALPPPPTAQLKSVPKLILYDQEINEQRNEIKDEVLDTVVLNAIKEETEEEERHRAQSVGGPSPSPNKSPKHTPPDSDPTENDLLVALERQRQALEKQRAAELEADKKRKELEDLEKQRRYEARRAAEEQQSMEIRKEKERKMIEVIEMKRQWIYNQMMFLEGQAATDRKGLEVAEKTTRLKLEQQIRSQWQFLLDRSDVPVFSAQQKPRYPTANNDSVSSPVRQYVAVSGDDIDKKVCKAVNKIFGKNAYTNTRIKRLAHTGEYVVFHKITGRRTIVYVREVRHNLMIRVGGGWDDFEGWLERHVNIGLEGEKSAKR